MSFLIVSIQTSIISHDEYIGIRQILSSLWSAAPRTMAPFLSSRIMYVKSVDIEGD